MLKFSKEVKSFCLAVFLLIISVHVGAQTAPRLDSIFKPHLTYGDTLIPDFAVKILKKVYFKYK
ncbi:MAG: hypothetical protein QM539_10245, partial [Alphaproteobacteria bacterium]|nr:hypothetical protein [Alphaproteobacteria bacterium]